MTAATQVATLAAAVGTGLTAGVYLAFSAMVMPAFAVAAPAAALRVMQRVNDLAERSVFTPVFLIAAAGSLWVLVAEWLPGGSRGAWPTAGAVLSLAASGVTAVVNVPRNRRVAALDPSSAADLAAWAVLAAQWSRGNHLRTLFASLGLAAFLV